LWWLETPNDRSSVTGVLADLAVRFRAKPSTERRVAIVTGGEADAGNAAATLRVLREAGYRTGNMPEDGAALMARLLCEPAEEALSFAEYSAFFASLPPELQRRVTERWGAAERDPLFRPGRLDCGHFAIPGLRRGNIAALMCPATDSLAAASHDPAPSHGQIAMYAWLADSFRADAVIDLGGQDTSKWMAVLAQQA
jgi:cobaltochelatase CobN